MRTVLFLTSAITLTIAMASCTKPAESTPQPPAQSSQADQLVRARSGDINEKNIVGKWKFERIVKTKNQETGRDQKISADGFVNYFPNGRGELNANTTITEPERGGSDDYSVSMKIVAYTEWKIADGKMYETITGSNNQTTQLSINGRRIDVAKLSRQDKQQLDQMARSIFPTGKTAYSDMKFVDAELHVIKVKDDDGREFLLTKADGAGE